MKQTKNLMPQTLLVRHVLDESQPLLLDVKAADALVLEPLQVALAHTGMRDAHLVGQVDGALAQLLGELVVEAQEAREGLVGAAVDREDLLVQLLVAAVEQQVGRGRRAVVLERRRRREDLPLRVVDVVQVEVARRVESVERVSE